MTEFLIRNDRESQWGGDLKTPANQSKPIYNVNIQEVTHWGWCDLMMWIPVLERLMQGFQRVKAKKQDSISAHPHNKCTHTLLVW